KGCHYVLRFGLGYPSFGILGFTANESRQCDLLNSLSYQFDSEDAPLDSRAQIICTAGVNLYDRHDVRDGSEYFPASHIETEHVHTQRNIRDLPHTSR